MAGYNEFYKPLKVEPSKPVSRVLYPSLMGRTVTIYLVLPLPEESSDQPGEKAGRPVIPLFGLAPDGVCPADRSPGRW